MELGKEYIPEPLFTPQTLTTLSKPCFSDTLSEKDELQSQDGCWVQGVPVKFDSQGNMPFMPCQSYYTDNLDQRLEPEIENDGGLSPHTRRRLMETISSESPASQSDECGYDKGQFGLPERPVTPTTSFGKYRDTRRLHVEGNVDSVPSSRRRHAVTAIPYDIE